MSALLADHEALSLVCLTVVAVVWLVTRAIRGGSFFC